MSDASSTEIELRAPDTNDQRRKLLNMLVGLAVAAGISPSSAAAQALSDDKLRRDIGDRARDSEGLLFAMVELGSERPNEALNVFAERKRALSGALADILNTRVKENEWIDLVASAQYALAIEMRQRDVRLAPTGQDAQAAADQIPMKDEPKGEHLWEVLLDIILDAVGIAELIDKVIDFVKRDARLSAILLALARAVQSKRFAEAALYLTRLMEMLVARPTLVALEAALGKEAMTRLLKGISARFVPFIGWAYFIASLLASIYRHRDKLAKATIP